MEIAIVVVVLLGVAAGIFFWVRSKTKRPDPDFVTRFGTEVWLKDGVEVSAQEFERAQEHFQRVVVGSSRAGHRQIAEIFKDMRVEIFPKALLVGGKKYNGLAFSDTGYLRVNWTGGPQKNALFHEFMHVIQYMLWNYRDSDHKKKEDWDIVYKAKREWDK